MYGIRNQIDSEWQLNKYNKRHSFTKSFPAPFSKRTKQESTPFVLCMDMRFLRISLHYSCFLCKEYATWRPGIHPETAKFFLENNIVLPNK